MILLIDIGNTNTHVGLATKKGVSRHVSFNSRSWLDQTAENRILKFTGKSRIHGVTLCSVVPKITQTARELSRRLWEIEALELNYKTARGIEIDYPNPHTIGADRLANAIAAKHHFGAPVTVVDFGTAVTFDVVNRDGRYIGGIITPGLSAMTDYLHEKTALLPCIHLREVNSVIGKSTVEAMLIGVIQGYGGMIQSLLHNITKELACHDMPLVATGGFAHIITKRIPEISAVVPTLTLEGMRLAWLNINSK
ncbi:MAG: type III pantothenate kinase [Verrucomicrobia bacterium]|nr:type III pantothenate kinase [Verrucomicrobiota bacterium]MCF7709207.1 type III pantothenate kinase [Verrucomicrobiota bacterium]